MWLQKRCGCSRCSRERGLCRPELPMGCCDHGGLQDQPPHGLNSPCAAAGLLQQTWAWQGGVPQHKTGLTGSWQLARFWGFFWPSFSPSDLPLYAPDAFTNAALLSLGGIENVSLMLHLDARACGGDLAALPTALGWRRGREAGSHGCWHRSGPSVALTCVSARWAAWWHCRACPPPPAPLEPTVLPGRGAARRGTRGRGEGLGCWLGSPGAGWLSPGTDQPTAAAMSGWAVHRERVWEGERLPKASSVRSFRVPQGPACWTGCGLHRRLAPAPSTHAGPVPGLLAGLVRQAHLHCAPGWDPLWKSGWGQWGDQRHFLLRCQHVPGVPWHRMPGCNAGTARATSLGQLAKAPAPAASTTATHSLHPRAEAPSSQELCSKSLGKVTVCSGHLITALFL